MQPFEFHGELFELRGLVLDALAANGFAWLSDFGSVDLSHDIYGLEVTGIREQDRATQIHDLLRELFPNWRFHRQYYEEENLREKGWKVIISREPEEFEGGGFEDDAPDMESELLEMEKCRREVSDRVVKRLSEQLLNPNLSNIQRAQLEKLLKELKKGQR